MGIATARPDYRPGDILTARDLAAGQDYTLERFRRHARYLHGWGVVCGLLVVPACDPRRPWAVRICPGYAISPCGDEIEVCRSLVVDLADYLWSRPTLAGLPAPSAYVAIRYEVEERLLVPVPPEPCGCQEPAWCPSRLRDSFRIDVLWTRPASGRPLYNVCSGVSAPCPSVPGSTAVLLAAVQLPGSPAITISVGQIVME